MAITPEIITGETTKFLKQDFLLSNHLRLLFKKLESAIKNCFQLKNLEIATGSGNPELAELVSMEVGKIIDPIMEQKDETDAVRVFNDGERRPIFRNSLRKKHTIIFQSFAPERTEGESDINDQLVELIIACENARRASSAETTVFMPYMSYARSDRKDMPRVGIAAKAILSSLEANGADRFVAMDVHKDQIAGFADVFDIIYSSEFFIPILKRVLDLENTVVASPDGSDSMANGWCKRLLGHPNNGKVTKFREKDSGKSEALDYNGPSVEGKTVVLVDDMIAGGGTIIDAARILKEKGASRVIVVAPHGLLLDGALEKIRDSEVDEVWISNSIRQSPDIFDPKVTGGKIRVFNIAEFLAEKLVRIHTGKSLEID